MVTMHPGLRVLVVEDDLDLAHAFADSLRSSGHDVAIATSGGSALAIAQAQPLDAVILDLGLPDVDGIEVARTLRITKPHADFAIIVITGLDVKRLEEADAAGIDLVLAKPVTAAQLGDLISYVWRNRRMHPPARS